MSTMGGLMAINHHKMAIPEMSEMSVKSEMSTMVYLMMINHDIKDQSVMSPCATYIMIKPPIPEMSILSLLSIPLTVHP
jgi:hypothetical protein